MLYSVLLLVLVAVGLGATGWKPTTPGGKEVSGVAGFVTGCLNECRSTPSGEPEPLQQVADGAPPKAEVQGVVHGLRGDVYATGKLEVESDGERQVRCCASMHTCASCSRGCCTSLQHVKQRNVALESF